MPAFTVTVAGENAKFWIATLVADTGFPAAVAPPAPGAPVAIPDMPGIGAGVEAGVVPPPAPAPDVAVGVAAGAYAGAAADAAPPDPLPQAARPGNATARTATANSRRGRRIVEEHHIG
ncbi:hypothetical protein [Frankia sp. ACN1ag]|uniref:hypothetical protein n=1 Tax=Frankia sp. ACN1ag TaxID=102891 RepID=UPI001F1CB70E|nr:hypothetical protein [Frankia sp. ACN1ag]